LWREIQRLWQYPDNTVQRAAPAQFAQGGIFFFVVFSGQTATINQHRAVPFQPLIFLQAGDQLLNGIFVSRDQ
jgi:hypothetical protein